MKSFCLLFFLLAAATCNAANPDKEIESLLHYLGALDGAVFIRNGSEHTAPEAEAHLRMKWEKQQDQIHSAEDFIRLCGTQSSMSGTPYEIRFKDGKQLPAAEVLRAELKRMRAAKGA